MLTKTIKWNHAVLTLKVGKIVYGIHKICQIFIFHIILPILQQFQITPNIPYWKFEQQNIKWNHAGLTLRFSEKLYMGYTTGIVVGKSVGK